MTTSSSHDVSEPCNFRLHHRRPETYLRSNIMMINTTTTFDNFNSTTNTTTDDCNRGGIYDGNSNDDVSVDIPGIVSLILLSVCMLSCGFLRPKRCYRARIAAAETARRRREEELNGPEPKDDPELRRHVVKTILMKQQQQERELCSDDTEHAASHCVFDEEAQSLRWTTTITPLTSLQNNIDKEEDDDDDDDVEVCDVEVCDVEREAMEDTTTTTATCSICLDMFENNDSILISQSCQNHIFHHDCLLEWCQKSDECPMCRTKMWSSTTYDSLMEIAKKEKEVQEATSKDGMENDDDDTTDDSSSSDSSSNNNRQRRRRPLAAIKRAVDDFLNFFY